MWEKKKKKKVPHWVRGSESLEMRSPRQAKMGILGLGGSIATPPGGITAEVLVVQSFDELASKASQAKGRIVVFNVPFQTYGGTVIYRSNGAAEAAKYGAVASLTRSITPESLYTPHTGSMTYSSNSSIPRIPAAAITIEGLFFFFPPSSKKKKKKKKKRKQKKKIL